MCLECMRFEKSVLNCLMFYVNRDLFNKLISTTENLVQRMGFSVIQKNCNLLSSKRDQISESLK